MTKSSNMPHALDAGLRIRFSRASLARASDARRWAVAIDETTTEVMVNLERRRIQCRGS